MSLEVENRPILTWGDYRTLLDHLDNNDSVSIEPLAAWQQGMPVSPSEIFYALEIGCRLRAKDDLAAKIIDAASDRLEAEFGDRVYGEPAAA